jgi:hypothetical protein
VATFFCEQISLGYFITINYVSRNQKMTILEYQIELLLCFHEAFYFSKFQFWQDCQIMHPSKKKNNIKDHFLRRHILPILFWNNNNNNNNNIKNLRNKLWWPQNLNDSISLTRRIIKNNFFSQSRFSRQFCSSLIKDCGKQERKLFSLHCDRFVIAKVSSNRKSSKLSKL